jgi:capsular polysaccharide export protein
LALRELKQRGFAVIPLISGTMDYQPTGIAEIDEIAGQIPPGREMTRWPGATGGSGWEIDYPARTVRYNGVEHYWGLREFLCCRERRYSMDFQSPIARARAANAMRRVEAIELCIARIAEIGKRLHLPIRIVVPYVHFGANFYARQQVKALSARQDIALIHVSNAYENYFSNFATDVSTAIAVRNVTEHDELSGALFAPRAAFEQYYQALANKEQLLDEVMQWIRQPRAQRRGGIANSHLLDLLKAERQRGKKIICLFGKVLFDLAMPRGDGPAHADMKEWFDHTVATAAAHDHVHLLIKPHPHEIRDEIALYPTEVLRDWLPKSLPANIHFLGHDEFNLFELAGVLDLALLWAGTAALELGALEVPTIVGAHYGDIDYPVGHILPQSRSHYEQLLVARDKHKVSTEAKFRAAALINYFRHPENSIRYRYTHRGLTNRSIRHLHWIAGDLEAYYAKNDPNVMLIADRIVAAKQRH